LENKLDHRIAFQLRHADQLAERASSLATRCSTSLKALEGLAVRSSLHVSVDHFELGGDVLNGGGQPDHGMRASSLRLLKPPRPIAAAVMAAPATAAKTSIMAGGAIAAV
jgi:hypothetical protein